MAGINSIDLEDLSKTEDIEVAEESYKDIAIIGMSGMFPQANNLDQLWQNIKAGLSSVTELPQSRKEDLKNYFYFTDQQTENSYLSASYLDQIDEFDYNFFNLTPKEASLMNPAQRLFLQTSWHALEQAGYAGNKLTGTNTGVYVGYIGDHEGYKYKEMIRDVEDEAVMEICAPGNLPSIIPSRLSYLLDLTGPSMLVDTACSSSLVALHLACQGIRNGDCNQALVGGVRVNLLPVDDNFKIGIESSDGVTRTFDDNSDGTGVGEGVVSIMLKPLAKARKDNDNIQAVIKGSAINQDGRSMGITAPNSKAQADLLVEAWKDAGIDPETISYIEAHGTGTPLGDPIEIEGINQAFEKYSDKKQFCAISSIKSNIGHLYDVAGLAGVVKAVLALKAKQLPPSVNFNKPNKNIDFVESPVYVCDKLRPWQVDNQPRRCGVSSFGFSGTNCHLVLEESPIEEGSSVENNNEPHLFTLSAKSKESFQDLINKYIEFLSKEASVSLTDLCYTAATGRGHYNYRLAVVVDSIEQLEAKLNSLSDNLEEVARDLYWDYHRVVDDETRVSNEKDITETKIEELSEQAEDKVNNYLDKEGEAQKILKELASLYVIGAEVSWEALYKNKFPAVISLPKYPFDKQRCWLDIPDYQQQLRQEMYYDLKWKKIDGELTNQEGQGNPSGAVLLFKDKQNISNQLVKQLQAEKREVIEVELGPSFVQQGENHYQVGAQAGDYKQLLQVIKNRQISQVVHIASIGKKTSNNLSQLKEAQDQGVKALFRFAKAYSQWGQDKDWELVLISDYAHQVTGSEQVLKPENAPLYALGKVIANEYSTIDCKYLDIDSSIDSEIISSWLNSPGDKDVVAYRKGNWYQREMQPVEIEDLIDQPVKLKESGVYVITGGASGIGAEIAKYLATKKNINLALIHRTKLPARDKWDQILQDETGSTTYNRIKVIKELEKLGAEVDYISADVTDYNKLEQVFRNLRNQFKAINGIIHCAGIINSHPIKDKSEKEFVSGLAPKITGTWILNEVTKEDKLDFLILFSSISTLLCSRGLSDYAAANTYLNAFAEQIRTEGRNAFAINWPAWTEAGMAATEENVETIFKGVNNELALACFEELLNKEQKNLIVGELNFNSRYIDLLDLVPVNLATEIKNQIKKYKNKSDQGFKQVAAAQSEEVTLVGKESQSYTEIEKKIAQICKRVLGFDKIDINQNFFDLGADSIHLSRMFDLLEEEFPGILTVAKVFAHPNVKALAEYVTEQKQSSGKAQKKIEGASEQEGARSKDVAIIGMALKFPMADTPDEFWANLRAGKDCITKLPDSRKQDIEDYLNFLNKNDQEYEQAAYLQEIDKFDYEFFNLSPREASLMDPNQRLFLQTAYEATEDAGYGGQALEKSKTGVFVGFSNNTNCDYLDMVSEVAPDSVKYAVPGNLTSIIPSRIAYALNLRGPSMLIDTACSSSLVAIHKACQSLRSKECDYALAGGVRLKLLPVDDDVKLGIESSTYKARTFDDSADGTGLGEGVGVVMLKPLSKAVEDKDNIYGVVKGGAINQDGKSVGITAPNTEAQTEVIIDAWQDAEVNPETIDFIEAHGTATELGDPIEIDGLTDAFYQYTDKKNFCAISSIKTNLGHLLEGAGISATIKSVLSLKNKELAPSLHFEKPNKRINFIESPVYVNDQLSKWQTDNSPRRCGISSFGFAGTNCHLILEEAPKIPVSKSDSSVNFNIFTISAKKEKLVYELVEEYIETITERKKELNIENLCYTSTTGRGHYQSRLALIVDSVEDLLTKLKEIKTYETMDKINQEEVYYGEWYVVSEDKEKLEQWDITEDRLKEVTKEANSIIKKITSEEDLVSNFQNLCKLYTKGADINWSKIYEGQQRKRVRLPVYPFEDNRCWLDIPEYRQTKDYRTDDYIHPLVEQCIIKSKQNDIYLTEFNVDKHFVLREHKVLGEYVVPGVTYVELAKQIGKLYYGEAPLELKELSFTKPVIVDEGETKPVQIIVSEEEDHLEFVVTSQDEEEGDTWVNHAEGRIYQPSEPNRNLEYNLDQLKEECSQEKMTNISVNELVKGFFEYGPRWENYHTLNMGEEAGLAEFKLDDSFKQDLEDYYVHPSLIDMSVGALALTLNGKYVPLAYKSFKIYGPTPQEFYSYVQQKDKNAGAGKEVLRYDAQLIAPDGRVFAEVNDFAIKKADKFQLLVENNRYSQLNWVEQERVDTEQEKSETVLVFTADNNLSQEVISELETKGEVITVSYGESYDQVDESSYIIQNKASDHNRLIEELQDKDIDKIIHLVTTSDQSFPQSITDLESYLEESLYSLFYMAKGLDNSDDNFKVVLVSKYANSVNEQEETIYPHRASMLALGEVVDNELSNINVKSVDIDNKADAQTIVKEVFAHRESKIAYREHNRYAEELDICEIGQFEDNNLEISPHGVYLITGGTGGIGLEISKYLASKNNVTICLVSRSGLPPREEWDLILNRAEDEKYCKAIKAIRDIEAKGSQVVCFKADVTEKPRIEAVINEITEEYGKLNGIIHGAGIAGEGFITDKDKETLEQVIKPKIHGTWVLNQVTNSLELDFMVLFSSVATVLRYPGQADYTAANAYLDSFAGLGKLQDRKITTINWTAWKETGMAVDYGKDVDTLFKAISTEEAISAFDEVLTKEVSQLVVGEINYSLLATTDNFSINFGNTIKERKERFAKKNRSTNQEVTEVKLKGKADQDYNQIERKVSQIWANVLGRKEIDIHKQFFDLGGDSIIASRLYDQIEQEFPNVLDITDVFSYSTVHKMSTYIEEKLTQNEEVAATEEAVEEEETGVEEIEKALEKVEAGELSIEEADKKLSEGGS